MTRDGTAEPISRDQILRCECGQGNIDLPSSADHVQDGQPYPVDPHSCSMCDFTSWLFYATRIGPPKGECVRLWVPVWVIIKLLIITTQSGPITPVILCY